MTEAAAQLHTSQPNISRLVSLLEREAGFRSSASATGSCRRTRPKHCSLTSSAPSWGSTACAPPHAPSVSQAWGPCASAPCHRSP
nr:LysR family transcriptional regulator [Cupriavidus sp. LEh25]